MTAVSRRAAIGAIAIGAAAPAIATGSASGAGEQISSRLAAAVRAHKLACDRFTRFSKDILEPAHAAWRADIDSLPTGQRTVAQYENIDGRMVSMNTSSPSAIGMAKRLLKDDAFVARQDPQWVAALREVQSAVDAREAELARLKARHRIDELAESEKALSGKEYDGVIEVIDTPASHLADVLWKIAFAKEQGETSEYTLDAIASDLRRMAAAVDDRGVA